jgi:hypothetical protein
MNLVMFINLSIFISLLLLFDSVKPVLTQMFVTVLKVYGSQFLEIVLGLLHWSLLSAGLAPVVASLGRYSFKPPTLKSNKQTCLLILFRKKNPP